MIINLSELPHWAKLEVTKADLEAFAKSLLSNHKPTSTPSFSTKKILTVEELAAYIDTAKQTIYGWTSKKMIPFHKHREGRKLYFVQSEIDEWLTSNRSATHAEIEAQALKHIEEQKIKRNTRR